MTVTLNCPNEHGEMAFTVADQETTFRGETILYQIESYVCNEQNR